MQQQELGPGLIAAPQKIFWRIMVHKLNMNEWIVTAAGR